MEDRHIEHGIQQCLHCFCRVRSHVIHNEDGIAAQMRHQVILKVRLEHFGSRSSWKSKYSAAFRPFESMIRWSYFLTWKAEQNQLLRYRRADKHIVWSCLYYIRFRPKTQDYLLWIQIYGLTSSSVFCYIEDAPVRWCEEISSYDDIPATEENVKRYRCLPEDLMLL